MSAVLAFWAVSLLLGLLALPVAFALLRRLPDAGAGLAIPLGLVFVSYGYFILRTLQVLPFGRGGYLIAIALLALLAAGVAGRDRRFVSTLRRSWPGWVAAAGLFTFFFFIYVAFRSYNADIGGTEQPMDFMYLNSALTSPDYPPKDPWLSGNSASYYYFGYVQTAVLTATSGVPASMGYNLGLAYTFAAAATVIASLGFALTRWILGSRGRRWAFVASGLSIVLLLFVGSLSSIFEWAAAHGMYNQSLYRTFGVEWLIPCKDGATQNCFAGDLVTRGAHWYPSEYFFWWRGSRIIPDTITEFPFFSFLLGDLHPHVMSIPLVMLSMGISASVWRGRRLLGWRSHLREPAFGIALVIIFGALAFQNAWDILTFTALLFLAVLARNARRERLGRALVDTIAFLLPVAALAVVAYMPWYVDFRSQAGGIKPYVGEGTRPVHAFLQFGPLLVAGLIALTWAFRRRERDLTFNAAVIALWLPMIPFFGWLAFAAARGELGDGLDARTASGWVTLILYGASVWLLTTAALVLRARRSAAVAVVAVAAVGALLLYGAELFYIKDIFESNSPRLNTVFKLSYQAWLLLALGGAVALTVALRKALRGRSYAAWLALPASGLVAAGLVYALITTPNRTEGFGKESRIDGLAFLSQSQDPRDVSEYALTRWVQAHTDPGDTVIEASGRLWRTDDKGQPVIVDASVDYSDAGRISARTGRSTAIGWYFHEIQWRGDSPANRDEFTRRQAEIDSVYTQPDAANVLSKMREMGANYLVLGKLELSKYPAASMPKYDQFLDVVFQSGDLRVYRMPVYEVLQTS